MQLHVCKEYMIGENVCKIDEEKTAISKHVSACKFNVSTLRKDPFAQLVIKSSKIIEQNVKSSYGKNENEEAVNIVSAWYVFKFDNLFYEYILIWDSVIFRA